MPFCEYKQQQPGCCHKLKQNQVNAKLHDESNHIIKEILSCLIPLLLKMNQQKLVFSKYTWWTVSSKPPSQQDL